MTSSARRRVASNTAVQLAGKGAVLALGVVSIAVLTRYLGPEDYGKYTLALMYMQLFGVLADVGLFTTVVREISKDPERTEELVGNTIALRLVLSIAVIALAAAVSLLLPYDHQVRVAILLAGAPLLIGMLTTTSWRSCRRACARGLAGVSVALPPAQVHRPRKRQLGRRRGQSQHTPGPIWVRGGLCLPTPAQSQPTPSARATSVGLSSASSPGPGTHNPRTGRPWLLPFCRRPPRRPCGIVVAWIRTRFRAVRATRAPGTATRTRWSRSTTRSSTSSSGTRAAACSTWAAASAGTARCSPSAASRFAPSTWSPSTSSAPASWACRPSSTTASGCRWRTAPWTPRSCSR